MNPHSALQQQFPLSTKKFKKKMIESMITLYVFAGIAVIFCIGIIILNAASTSQDNQFISVVFGIVAAVIILGAIVITFLYAWYVKAYIKRYFYAGEEHFITIKKGVFAPAEIHVQWQKIQDVYVDQDILDRMMGLYDVHIASATAASGIEAHIDGVDEAAAMGLKTFLLNKVSGSGMNTNAQSTTSALGTVGSNTPTSVPSIPATRINLSEEISNTKYPLSSTWLTIALIGRIVSSAIAVTVVVFGIGAEIVFKSEHSNVSFAPVVIIWLILLVLVCVWNVISLLLWKKNYAFNFTPDNIYYREGVISLSEKHMPYSSIQDVTVQQGVLERMVGLAKVRIENAAQGVMVQQGRNGRVAMFSGILLQGLTVADANKITDMLKTTVLGKNSRQYGL